MPYKVIIYHRAGKFWHDVASRCGTLRRLVSYCELGFKLFGSHRDYIGWIISKILNTELCEGVLKFC